MLGTRRGGRSGARRVQRRPSRPVRKTSGGTRDAKGTLLTAVIWVLAVVNLVLVGSLVSRYVAPKRGQRAVLLSEDSLKVEVLNGCGKAGLAKEVTDYLRNRSFDVVKFENYEGGFNVRKTLVIDRRAMDLSNAKRVAEALGVNESEVLAELSEARVLDVTVILGKDYRQLRPYRN